MKKFIIISILSALVNTGTILMAQNQQEEYLGLPGDNLNLYAVMNLFQESQTIEGFERSLNDKNSRINNLDLNGDNQVDYIRVNDYVDGDVHTIVLRAALNRNEDQDVAVFTVQRFRNGSVQIQLVGDEELYGRNYIIEPIYDDNLAETPNPGYNGISGNTEYLTVVRTTPYEIAEWPLIRFIYLPTYVSWRSSWYWDYYPSYWNPWRPYYYHYYYGYHYNLYPHYYEHYRHWDHHRYARYNDFYYNGIRAHSHNVSERINAGNYRNTYSHPDQRRDGERMFARMNPSATRRSSENYSGSNVAGRSGSRSNQGRESIGMNNNTTRRSTSTGMNRSVTNPERNQNLGTTRRSNNTVNNRPVMNQRSEQSAATTRRSSNSVNNRSLTNARSGQSESTARRSNNTVSNRSVINSRSGQSVSNGRKSGNTMNNRSVTSSRPEQSVSTSRRSITTMNSRSVTNSQPEQSVVTSRRSAATMNSKAAASPRQEQRASANRVSRQSSAGMSSSNRRNSESRKSVMTARQSEKTKQSGSDSRNDTRRR